MALSVSMSCLFYMLPHHQLIVKYKVILIQVVSIWAVNCAVNCAIISQQFHSLQLCDLKMFLINNARYTNTQQANRWGRGNQAVRNGMAEWMTKRWGRGRKRTVTIHDTFVNKVRNGTTQEYMENNRSFDTSSWWGSCSGMKTQQNSSSNR